LPETYADEAKLRSEGILSVPFKTRYLYLYWVYIADYPFSINNFGRIARRQQCLPVHSPLPRGSASLLSIGILVIGVLQIGES